MIMVQFSIRCSSFTTVTSMEKDETNKAKWYVKKQSWAQIYQQQNR